MSVDRALLNLGRIPYPELSSDTSLRGGLALLKYTMEKDPPRANSQMPVAT